MDIKTLRKIPALQPFRPAYRALKAIYNYPITMLRIIRGRRNCRLQIQQQIEADNPIMVILGAGGDTHVNWISTDLPFLDLTQDRHWASIFQPQSISNILAEHVFEHLTEQQFRQFLSVISTYLKENAIIRIAVPDGYHSSAEYIEWVRPNGTGAGAQDHKILYNYQIFAHILDEAGFDYKFLEYFDEHGNFHKVEWDDSKGVIKRCQDKDHRNTPANPTVYTSLILDLWVSQS